MKGKDLLLAASMVMFSSMIYDAKAAEEYMDAPTVVITGTRTEQLLEDVPAAMEVITSEQIAEMGASDVQEVLQQAFGLVTDGTHGGVYIRGTSATVFINGRRPIIFGSPNETNRRTMDFVNAENIERIEILRGPSSALYGDSMGSVINIITKKSTEKESTLRYTMGTEESVLAFRHDFGQMGNWSNVFAMETVRSWGSDEHRYGADRADTNNLNELFLSNSLAYTFDNGNALSLDSNYLVRDAEDTGMNETVYSNALLFNGTAGDHMYSFGASHSQNARAKSYGRELSTVVIIDAQDSWMVNDWNTLTFGGEFRAQNMNSTGVVADDGALESYGVYLQDEISLFDEKLYLVPAIRMDYYSSFGMHFSPKLGVTYEYLPNHRVKGSIGTNYRAPTVVELYGQSSGGSSTTIGNADLEPEESTNWEIRFEGDLTNQLSYALGYFYGDYTNKMVSEALIGQTDPYTGKPLYKKINIGKARTQGVEAEINYDFMEYFTLGLQYTYLNAKNLDDNTYEQNAPFNTFGASLDFRYTPWDLHARVWGKYFQNLVYDGKDFRGDYFKYSMNIAKYFEDGKYMVAFDALNFLQTDRNPNIDNYINPSEYKVTFQVKF